MPRQTSKDWKSNALAALFVLAGAAAIWKFSGECPFRPNPGATANPSTSTQGEQNMSVTSAKGKILHAGDATFRDVVLKSDVPVLVDFYADWCGPCRRLAPILEELAAENPQVKIVKVNVDESSALAAEYGINSIPALKLFKNGAVAEEMVGLAGKGELQQLLAR